MRLRTYAAVNLSALTLIVLLVSTALALGSNYLAQSVDHMGQATESVHIGQRLEVTLLANFRDIVRATREGADPNWIEDQQVALDAASARMLQQLEGFVGDAAEAELVRLARSAVADYQVGVAEVAGKRLGSDEAYTILTPRIDQVQLQLDRLVELNLAQARSLRANSDRASRRADYLALGTILLLVLLLPATVWYARRYVYMPLRHIAWRLGSFSTHAAPTPLPTERLDELSQISGAFNAMADRLHAQKQAQAQHLASIAHDLRSPLAAIIMSTERLGMVDHAAGENLQLTQLIQRQAEHLQRIVGDLLEVGRVEAGQIELDTSLHDLRPMIAEVVKLFEPVSTKHTFSTILPPDPVVCRCDLTRLNQVVVNLLSNAIKYSPDGGEIVVSVRQEQDQAVIAVVDHGLGISQQDQLKLFEPFRRGATVAKAIPGVGLGLAGARRIVEAHRGRIAVDSEPGRGSTFSVMLPRPFVT